MTDDLRKPVNSHPECCEHLHGKRTVAQFVTGPASGERCDPWCTKYNMTLLDLDEQGLDACSTGGDCPIGAARKAT